MKSLKYLFVALVGLLISGCADKVTDSNSQADGRNLQQANVIKIGSNYQAMKDGNTRFRLESNGRFILLVNRAYYKTELELDEVRKDNERNNIYPEIYLAEGRYEKNSQGFHLITERRVTIYFSSVKNIKRKVIAQKLLEDQANPDEKFMTLDKKSTYYMLNDNQPVYATNEAIPDSVEDFLAQYKYEPEELE